MAGEKIERATTVVVASRVSYKCYFNVLRSLLNNYNKIYRKLQ